MPGDVPSNTSPRIRVIALGLMQRQDGRLLLERGVDHSTGAAFYRPVGGGVEFGEGVNHTLQREFMEELGLEIAVGEKRAVIENIFTYEGRAGHASATQG